MPIDQNMLNDLKKGILLSGRLSEVHIKNMQMYPFIFFDHIASVTIQHDIVVDPLAAIPGAGSVVRYTLSFNEGYVPDLLEVRLKALVGATHTLLWPSIDVEVFDSNKNNLIESIKEDKNVKESVDSNT